MEPRVARRLNAVTNTVHSFVYFVPEARDEYATLGVTGQAGYFASRGAPLGAASAELIAATFFNFAPGRVAESVPAVWEIATPEDMQAARFRAVARTLERVLDPPPTAAAVAEATEIAGAVCSGVGYEGKPLAAGNRAVVLPDDPLVRLWQLVTTIREWRGDAHVGVLSTTPVTAVEALVLHTATGKFPIEVLRPTRGWPEERWGAAVADLAARGLVHDDGSFTEAGAAFREEIEHRTDVATMPLWDAVGEDATLRLAELLTPIQHGLVAAGVFPFTR